MDPTILSTATVPAIVATVALLRQLGLPDRDAPLVALALGLVAQVLHVALPGHPNAGPLLVQVLQGLTMGLSAVGAHATVKHAVKPSKRHAAKRVRLQERAPARSSPKPSRPAGYPDPVKTVWGRPDATDR